MRQRIRYRRRGPKYPLPDVPDPIYYSALEADAAAELIYGTPYSQNQRMYIDPWDLENYDYVRRQLSLSPGPSSTPSPAGEPISSTFTYLPTNSEECPACCAELDEQTFYNAKYETIRDEDLVYNSYTGETDLDSSLSSMERNSSCGESAVSSLMLHTPGFGAISGRRRMILPKPAPQLEFPAPPPYDYCIPMPEDNYCSLSECYDCMSDTACPVYAPPSSLPFYGRSQSPIYQTTKRFGLSKKGLLQIDYSCNWNNLDRYIANEM